MSVPAIEVGEVVSTGFVITLAASPVVLAVLRRRHIVDVPSERSSHVVPTPRGGGLACTVGLLGAVLLSPSLAVGSKLLLLTGGGVLAALGFVDDLHPLTVSLRLGVQVVAAVGASCWAFDPWWPASIGALALAVASAIWMVAYVNAFNFMDGINGLAGAATAVAGLTFALIGIDRNDAILAFGGAATVGAAIAFLPWNFPQARFFLGDVGSYLFGGTTAILVALGVRDHIPIEALLGAETILVADTAWTLLTRVARGEPWTSPHRSHVYQRLQGTTGSHSRTTLMVAALVLATAALGLVSLTGSWWPRLAADATGAVLITAYLASPGVIRRAVQAPR